MHRGWLLLPAFIISTVSIIGLLNGDSGRISSDANHCRSVDEHEEYEPQITVLLSTINTRQGYPVDISEITQKRISANQISAKYPLSVQDLDDFSSEAIWADNIPTGSTLERIHILLPNDTNYQAIANVRNYATYPLIIEQQLLSEHLIKAGTRVDITLIRGVDRQPGRFSYSHDTSRLSATTVATDVLITDIQPFAKSMDNNPLVTVTLSVAPEHVKKLMLARHAGVLELTPSTALLTDDLAIKEALPGHSGVTELRGDTSQKQGGSL